MYLIVLVKDVELLIIRVCVCVHAHTYIFMCIQKRFNSVTVNCSFTVNDGTLIDRFIFVVRINSGDIYCVDRSDGTAVTAVRCRHRGGFEIRLLRVFAGHFPKCVPPGPYIPNATRRTPPWSNR